MSDPGTTVPVSELTNARLWRERYAHGVVLGGSANLETAVRKAGGDLAKWSRIVGMIPDSVIEWHLRAVTSELEIRLGQPLKSWRCLATPVDDGLVLGRDYDCEVPRLPFNMSDLGQWFRIDLPGGVNEVTRVRGYYFGQRCFEWSADQGNESNIFVEWRKTGIVHIIPRELQSLIALGVPGGGLWTTMVGLARPVPNFWAVDYRRGPVAEYGGPGQIEAAFVDWVSCSAGIRIFSLSGTIQSAGIANTSISIDGISESIGTTASAVYGLFSAYETVLKDRVKGINIERLVRLKRGLRIRHLGI